MHAPEPPPFNLAVDRFGDASRTVVLAHGGGQTRHAWRATAERLAGAGWTALTFDLRGHGESDRAPGGIYSAETFMDDVASVVSRAPSSPVVVGASLGGAAALLAVTERALDVRALVLVDVGIRLRPAGVDRIMRFMRAFPDGFASLADAGAAVAAYAPRSGRGASRSGLERNLACGDDGRWRWRWDPSLLERFDPSTAFDEARLRRALENLNVPLLVVRGGRSDVLDAEAAAETAALGRGSVVDVAGAAHMVAGDANDAFATTLLDFVERL